MKTAFAQPLLAFAVALGALSSAAPGYAQPSNKPASGPGQPTPSEASERFQRGVASFREGDFDAALAEFSRAYKLSPNYRLLYNLAQVQAERHDSLAALKLLAQYLAEAGNALDDERRTNVLQMIEELQRHVAELRVGCNVTDAELAVDGIVVGRIPLTEPLRVNAGSHNVRLTKEGYRSASKDISIAGGLVETLLFELDPKPKQPSLTVRTNASDARAPASAGMGGAFWTSVACAAAFTGAAASFGILAAHENRKLDNELQTFPTNQQSVVAERNRVKNFALLSDVFGAGAILAVSSSVYFAIRGSEPPSSTHAASRAPQVRAYLAGSAIFVQGEL